MTETTATRPEVRDLPVLDTTAIHAAAEAWVAGRLTDTDPEALAVAAHKIIDTERAHAQKAREDRDVALWTLDRHYRVRRGTNLVAVMGLHSRAALTKVREKMREREAAGDFTPATDPAAQLVKASKTATVHTARAEAAIPYAERAIAALLADGWSNAAIGRLVGRDHSLVSRHRRKQEVA